MPLSLKVCTLLPHTRQQTDGRHHFFFFATPLGPIQHIRSSVYRRRRSFLPSPTVRSRLHFAMCNASSPFRQSHGMHVKRSFVLLLIVFNIGFSAARCRRVFFHPSSMKQSVTCTFISLTLFIGDSLFSTTLQLSDLIYPFPLALVFFCSTPPPFRGSNTGTSLPHTFRRIRQQASRPIGTILSPSARSEDHAGLLI